MGQIAPSYTDHDDVLVDVLTDTNPPTPMTIMRSSIRVLRSIRAERCPEFHAAGLAEVLYRSGFPAILHRALVSAEQLAVLLGLADGYGSYRPQSSGLVRYLPELHHVRWRYIPDVNQVQLLLAERTQDLIDRGLYEIIFTAKGKTCRGFTTAEHLAWAVGWIEAGTDSYMSRPFAPQRADQAPSSVNAGLWRRKPKILTEANGKRIARSIRTRAQRYRHPGAPA